MQILGEAGVPCSATHSTYDLFHNPHFDERDFIQDIDHPEWGPIRLLGWAPKMSKSNVPDDGGAAAGRAHARSVV